MASSGRARSRLAESTRPPRRAEVARKLLRGLPRRGWPRLAFDSQGRAAKFESLVVAPVRALARHTVDLGAILSGLANPFKTIADEVASAYRKHLFGDATLQDLPNNPRFVLNATNVQ